MDSKGSILDSYGGNEQLIVENIKLVVYSIQLLKQKFMRLALDIDVKALHVKENLIIKSILNSVIKVKQILLPHQLLNKRNASIYQLENVRYV